MPRARKPERRKLISLQDYAEECGVTVKFLRDRIADGTLPAYKLGSVIRVDPDEADQALVRRIPTVRR